MSDTKHPDSQRDRSTLPRNAPALSLERFARLLDAYGATPARWPEAERAAAERLLQHSAAARTLRDEAAELDVLLDTVTLEPPSADLAARVLAAPPRRRTARRARWVAAVPLAAAAGVALWLVSTQEPGREVAGSRVVAVGDYSAPTDALLGSFTIDASAAAPAVGCLDSVLGCPAMNAEAQKESRG